MDVAKGKFDVGDLKFAAFGDRVLIKEDEFKSGYECTTCSGLGKVQCSNCKGAGIINRGGPDMTCSPCHGTGKLVCPTCDGKGGLLIVAEESQRRPTTGEVVSVGPDVKNLQVGQSVLYSSFAGHTVDLNRAGVSVVIRILHEPEILCLVEGHLTLRQVRGKSEIAAFSN